MNCGLERNLKLSFLKVWGCDTYVKRLQPDKLEPKSEKCVFIGVIAWLIRDDRLLISIRNSFFSGSPFRQNSKVKHAQLGVVCVRGVTSSQVQKVLERILIYSWSLLWRNFNSYGRVFSLETYIATHHLISFYVVL